MEEYKNQQQQKTILLEEDITQDFKGEATKECFELIKEVAKKNEEKMNESLELIKNFIQNNNKLIDPIIYIRTGFINQIVSYLIAPSLAISNELNITIIELLTDHEVICDYIISNDSEKFDIMLFISMLISEEPNVKISEQYINIIIHLLPSFFKYDHIESELFINHISSSSAHYSVIKFITHLLYRTDTIGAPKEYIKILYEKLELIDLIDEDVLSQLFLCFCYLSKYDISNNVYILENFKKYPMPIFEYVFKYFDKDVHIHMKKVMDPLFTYIASIFNHQSVEKLNYEKYIFRYVTGAFDFFMNVYECSNETSIRKNALICINDAIHLESLKEYEEMKNFLNDMDLFQYFVNILKKESAVERAMAFNIIMKKMQIIRKDTIEYIYDLDFLDDVRDFICLEPSKSILFFVYLLFYMDKNDRGKEVASRIKELNVFDEIDYYLSCDLASKQENEEDMIFECKAELKKLMDVILGEEEE